MADPGPWTVAITRPAPKIPRTERVFAERGFEPVSAPALEIQPHEDPALRRILDDLERGNIGHVVFTGATGVAHAWERAEDLGAGDLAARLDDAAVVAIGPRTASALEERGVAVEAVPETHSSAGLVEWFRERDPVAEQVALLRSTQGTAVLPKGLRDLGARVREAHVYDLARPDPSQDHERLFAALEEDRLDAYTFTSSLTAEHFLELADLAGPGAAEARRRVAGAAVGAIGEPTRETLEEAGIPVDVVPDEARVQALADALARHLGAGSDR